MLPYANAIASIESAGSGDYNAVGPLTKKGNRAYGKYQVMDFNVGPWTKEALGQELTPQQFMASPQAQDAVFNHVFGKYVKEHGPAGAAAKWFSGSPNTQSSASDGYTTVPEYVNKFNKALGGNMDPMAAAMAQQQQQAPALSTGTIMGPGALSPQASKTNWGNVLTNVGLLLRDDPAALRHLKDGDGKDDNVFSTHIDPNTGTMFRLNRKTGQVDAQRVGATRSKDQDAWDAANGKMWVERNEKIGAAGQKAQGDLAVLNRALELSKDPNVSQGLFGEQALMFKKAADWFGLDVKGVKEGEELQALANKVTLTLRNTADGNGMPGALSDNDLKFLKSSNFGLDKSPAGNQAIINAGIKVAQRQIEYDQLRQQYIEQRGRLDNGFTAYATQYFAKKGDLFANEAAETSSQQKQRRPLGAFGQ